MRIPFLSRDFNEAVLEGVPNSFFCRQLILDFNFRTARKIVNSMQRLGLPLPQSHKDYMDGWEGCLLFLNQYGLALRIEKAKFKGAQRVNDPWMIQPIAKIRAGKAIIEICPGCHQAKNKLNSQRLIEELRKRNLEFWDFKISNGGNLPVKTVHFPEGIPVVIDRGAVKRLSFWSSLIKKRLDERAREADEAQKQLYEPLRRAFKLGWRDPQKMELFWSLCESYQKEGKLVAGWNEEQTEEVRDETYMWYGGFNQKTLKARDAAKSYDETMAAAKTAPRPSHGLKLF